MEDKVKIMDDKYLINFEGVQELSWMANYLPEIRRLLYGKITGY